MVAVHSFENSLGYMIVDERRFLLYPWIGITSLNISSNRETDNTDNNEGPNLSKPIAGLTIGYRFGDVFSDISMASFEIRSRISYTRLQYFDNLDLTNIRIGLCFVFHIRGSDRRKTTI